VALVYLFQESCPARRALVRLWLEELYMVCPEASLLQGAWRVAPELLEWQREVELRATIPPRRVPPAADCLPHLSPHELVAEHSWDSRS